MTTDATPLFHSYIKNYTFVQGALWVKISQSVAHNNTVNSITNSKCHRLP